MSAATRIYLTTDVQTKAERLIRATAPSTARAHAARKQFTATVATQGDLERLLPTMKVEIAGADEPAATGA